MPIKIPSKNIYNKTLNILKNNKINKIISTTNTDKINISSDTTVANFIYTDEEVITKTSDIVTTEMSAIYQISEDRYNLDYRLATVQIGVVEYETNKKIKIPKTYDLLTVINSVNIDPLELLARTIDIEITYKTAKGRVITHLIDYGDTLNNPYHFTYSDFEYSSPSTTEITKSLREILSNGTTLFTKTRTVQSYDTQELEWKPITIEARNAITNNTRLNGLDFYEDNDYFYFSISISSGYKLVEFDDYNVVAEVGATFIGSYIDYVPISIKIMPKGVLIGVKFEEQPFSLSSGTQSNYYEFSVPSNELMQTRNTRKFGENTESAITALANDILTQYSDGKEMATLNCSYDEYYNADGTKAISLYEDGLPMSFKIGDIVTPYIKKPSVAEDIPLSTKSDGTPKDFVVTKIKNVDDGVSMQEITIVEN